MKINKFKFLFIVSFFSLKFFCLKVQGSEWEILNPSYHRISAIEVHAGNFVDSIKLFYTDPVDGISYSLGGKVGGQGGTLHREVFEEGEKLVEIYGWKGCCIDSITFITTGNSTESPKVYGPYGGTQGVKKFNYQENEIYGLRGLRGYFCFKNVITDIGIITCTPYKINAVIKNFQYEEDLDNIIKNHRSRLDLIEDRTIINKSDAQLIETVSYIKSFEETFSYGFRESLSFAAKTEINIGLPFTFGSKSEINFNGAFESNQQVSQKETRTYTINRQFNVPPKKSVKISAYVNWIEGLQIPFKADLEITATHPAVNLQIIKQVLRDNYFNGDITGEEGATVFAKINGELKCSYGLNSMVSAHNIDE